LPSAVPSANRLLYIGLRQMPLVQAKYRVRGPDESLDGHEADILRPSTEGATELIGRDTTDSLNISLTYIQRVRERGCLAAQQRRVRALHTQRKQLAVTLDVLISLPTDSRLLEPLHARWLRLACRLARVARGALRV
jgi:hypothetical protein